MAVAMATTLDDGASTDDEEERASKAAFFHELERRHGGPLSYEELQEFELSLKSDDSDSDDDEDVPPCTFGAPSIGKGAPPAATSSCGETPGCGWMTPATPRHGKAASPGASTAAGSDDDVVVTEAVGSRFASRRGSPGVCRPADLGCLPGLALEAAALPPMEVAASPKPGQVRAVGGRLSPNARVDESVDSDASSPTGCAEHAAASNGDGDRGGGGGGGGSGGGGGGVSALPGGMGPRASGPGWHASLEAPSPSAASSSWKAPSPASAPSARTPLPAAEAPTPDWLRSARFRVS